MSSSPREGLKPGQTIGNFEIVSTLGAGGMGEVYRARDTRLDRDVAIKVLHEQFSSRFAREARVIAALNHPNICQLYDIGPDYLVMELVDGESPRGPMPLSEGMALARQIADALDAAHQKGIVHRDLKPENIKVTPAGVVKVLDFGLATESPAAPAGSGEQAPTRSMTAAGTIVGTAAYMAPEQARGKAVDKRADIWAFGAVFYELLTGAQLFQGEDATEILAAIVQGTPDLSRAPVEVRLLLAACLEKNPDKRLRDIGDVWRLVQEPAGGPVAKRQSVWPWAVAAVLAMAGLWGWFRHPQEETPAQELALTIVPPAALDEKMPVGFSSPVISPDGSMVLFRTSRGLFVRRLDSLEAQRVLGSESASSNGFWSPDSTTVAFPGSSGLVKVRVPDGAPEILNPLSAPSRGGTWGDDSTILIAERGLSVVPASGGELQRVSGLAPGVLNPEFLPGSDDFLYLQQKPNNAEPGIYLATLRGAAAERPTLLFENSTSAHYTPAGGGRVLFVRNDNLYSQKLNRKARKLEGEATLVAAGVASYSGGSINGAEFSVARNGSVVWRPGASAYSQVTTFDRQGNVVGTTGPRALIRDIALSPDDQHVLENTGDGSWVFEAGKAGGVQLPTDVNWRGWVQRGTRPTVFGIGRGMLMEVAGDGTGGARVVGRAPEPQFTTDGTVLKDMLRDGKSALFASHDSTPTARAVMMSIPVQSTTPPRTGLVESREPVFGAEFAPDGRWVVYTLGFRPCPLFVQAFPRPEARRQIAADAVFPVWRGDGKEILFVSAGEEVTSVAVEGGGGELRFRDPQILFKGLRRGPGQVLSSTPLAVSRDGSRIYWTQGPERPDSSIIHVKMGWLKP